MTTVNLPELEFPQNPFQLYQYIGVPFLKQVEISDGPAYLKGYIVDGILQQHKLAYKNLRSKIDFKHLKIKT